MSNYEEFSIEELLERIKLLYNLKISCKAIDDAEVTMKNMSYIQELIEEIDLLKKLLRDRMVKAVEGDMVWARFRYDEGGADYAERIEFADFYFKLSDILEELYSINRYQMSEVLNLQLKIKDAYSSLNGAVML